MSDPAVIIDELQRGIDAGHHIGAAAAVVRDGKLVLDVQVGARALPPDDDPLDADTLLLWMSAGKPLLAATALTLVEEGRIGLDDAVADHLPGFGQGGKDAVTLRHVLTHTGGFRAHALGMPIDDWAEAKAAALAAKLEPRWQPGVDAGYHVHSGWDALGALVEHLTGTDVGAAIRERVCGPLAMTDTFPGFTPDERAAHAHRMAAVPDTRDPAAPAPGTYAARLATFTRPGGNTWGPARDLARFYDALLRGGGGVLRPETVAQMTARQRAGVEDRTFRGVIDWGLGLTINSAHLNDAPPMYGFGTRASRNTFGHGGNQASMGWADPEAGFAAAVIFNGMPGEKAHQPRARAAIDAVYGVICDV